MTLQKGNKGLYQRHLEPRRSLGRASTKAFMSNFQEILEHGSTTYIFKIDMVMDVSSCSIARGASYAARVALHYWQLLCFCLLSVSFSSKERERERERQKNNEAIGRGRKRDNEAIGRGRKRDLGYKEKRKKEEETAEEKETEAEKEDEKKGKKAQEKR